MYEYSSFSTSLPALVIIYLLYYSHSSRCMHISLGFCCAFPDSLKLFAPASHIYAGPCQRWICPGNAGLQEKIKVHLSCFFGNNRSYLLLWLWNQGWSYSTISCPARCQIYLYFFWVRFLGRSSPPQNSLHRNFPGGPLVNANAGDIGSKSGPGTKIPHALGQLSLCATTTET